MKFEVFRIAARNRLLAAALMLLSPCPSYAAENACSKLVRHEPVEVMAIRVSGSIYWNGMKVTQAEFDRYLRETTKAKPIYHLTWAPAELARAKKLERQIRDYGFEVAINCPPISPMPY